MAAGTETTTQDRRAAQRDRLIALAEQRIAAEGLTALRARDLAKDMGCALGAIYNLVSDLDELVLLVARRTLRDLAAQLDAVSPEASDADVIVAWATAYLGFARDNRRRWQALFTFRLPVDTPLPRWFAEDQEQIFVRLEDRLAPLMPDAAAADRKLKARILFSAVHGIVAMGLEEKIVSMPLDGLADGLTAFVRAYLRGLDAT